MPCRQKVAAGPFSPCFAGDAGRLRVASNNRAMTLYPRSHTYSEPSRHEDSLGTTFYIPYLFKNLSRLQFSDPFFGLIFGPIALKRIEHGLINMEPMLYKF